MTHQEERDATRHITDQSLLNAWLETAGYKFKENSLSAIRDACNNYRLAFAWVALILVVAATLAVIFLQPPGQVLWLGFIFASVTLLCTVATGVLAWQARRDSDIRNYFRLNSDINRVRRLLKALGITESVDGSLNGMDNLQWVRAYWTKRLLLRILDLRDRWYEKVKEGYTDDDFYSGRPLKECHPVRKRIDRALKPFGLRQLETPAKEVAQEPVGTSRRVGEEGRAA